MLEHLVDIYKGSMAVVKTKSAMNPILILCIISVPSFIWAASHSQNIVRILFVLMSFFPVLAAVIAYFIWMYRDPKRLQTEEYQLQHEAMLQAAKGQRVLPASMPALDHQQPILGMEAEEADKPEITNIAHNVSDQGGPKGLT